MGPKTKASDELHAMKYRDDGEDFRDAMNRIASTLTDNEEDYYRFRDTLLEQRFLPAGRIQSAVGSVREVTPFNCYVSGVIEDTYVDEGGIMDRAKEAAATMRMGGGIGYDFSSLRPRGDRINKLNSYSSGPVSFMHIFNAVCLATSSSGHRRGAQMGVMRVDHPDIVEFIHAKQNGTDLQGFNISIAVTDEFMEAVKKREKFDLRWGGKIYNTIDAASLWETIMRSTWDWAEPGVLFIDRINDMNNLYYCEEIFATNPCGEQPLPPYGACLLGSFNLVKYLKAKPVLLNDEAKYTFDYDKFKADIPHVVEAVDNIIDIADYPLPEQEQEAKNKRRMGLGVTGLANALEACGHPYGSDKFLYMEGQILSTLKNEAYRASALLAKKKGAFPLYNEKYLKGKFVQKLDHDVKVLINLYGIRNSHLTSIAPTGTISFCADNVSSGLEPVFSYTSERPINTPDGTVTYEVADYGYKFLGVEGKQTKDVTAIEHVHVLETAQRHVDSAVSKTCNVTGDMDWADFKDIYMFSWQLGAKGCTTFNQDGKRMALLKPKSETESNVVQLHDTQPAIGCEIDPETGQRECG